MNKWLHIVAIAILVVGSIVSAVGLFYTKRTLAATTVIVLTVLAAIYVGVRRDTYLPFLGETVLPCSLLKESVPEHADTEVTVSGLEPGVKVLFWASEPATDGLARINTWQRAYLEYANAGVTRVDAGGHVTMRIRKPQAYSVPIKGRLEAHVHWRVCKDGGNLGPVQTTMVGL
jgi:hypothetical protein